MIDDDPNLHPLPEASPSPAGIASDGSFGSGRWLSGLGREFRRVWLDRFRGLN